MMDEVAARLIALRDLLGPMQARLAKRRAPSIGTCQVCGHQQEMMPSWQPIASSMGDEQWRCQECRGQIAFTITIGGDEPSADEDLATLLNRLLTALPDEKKP